MKAKGFTLIEILLVIGMITIITGISFPAYQVMYFRSELDVAANAFVQGVRRAQVLSRAQVNNQSWGVYIQPGQLSVFSGISYSQRDPLYDETFQFPDTIEIEGIQEFNFRGIYGFPISIGETVLTSVDGATRTVTVNGFGVVNF